MSWGRRFRAKEYLRTSLWVIPVAFVAFAVVVGLVVPEIDRASESSLSFPFGAGAAIAALSAIAGGMITFTGFVFSVLLVAIQFGSSQFTPRLLGALFRRNEVKVAIGSFVATFTYALLVLASTARGDDPDFVPTLSVTVAIAFLLLSVAMFLRLFQSVGHDLRAGSLLDDAGRIGIELIEETYPREGVPDETTVRAAPQTPDEDRSRHVDHRGRAHVLLAADFEGIAAAAQRVGATVYFEAAVGDFVATGAPLFRVVERGARLDDDQLLSAVAFGAERTVQQDLPFVFRILVDIASKALSPGVNDPTTAVQALDQIEDLLVLLAVRDLSVGEIRDADGHPRVRWPVPSWDGYLVLALTEIRQFGEGSAQISRRMLALLDRLDEVVPEGRRAAVDRQRTLIEASVERAFAPAERAEALVPDHQGIGAGAVSAAPTPESRR